MLFGCANDCWRKMKANVQSSVLRYMASHQKLPKTGIYIQPFFHLYSKYLLHLIKCGLFQFKADVCTITKTPKQFDNN